MNDYITYFFNIGHRRSNHSRDSDTEEFYHDTQYREAPLSVGECVSLEVRQCQPINPLVYATVRLQFRCVGSADCFKSKSQQKTVFPLMRILCLVIHRIEGGAVGHIGFVLRNTDIEPKADAVLPLKPLFMSIENNFTDARKERCLYLLVSLSVYSCLLIVFYFAPFSLQVF